MASPQDDSSKPRRYTDADLNRVVDSLREEFVAKLSDAIKRIEAVDTKLEEFMMPATPNKKQEFKDEIVVLVEDIIAKDTLQKEAVEDKNAEVVEQLQEEVEDIRGSGHRMIIHHEESKVIEIEKEEKKKWEENVIEPVLEYEFKESMWDAAFFLFDKRTGIAANIATLLLLLIHIGSQIIFMGILYKYFFEPEFGPETVREMKEWRINVGQSQFWVDPAKTGVSLVYRVCSLDGSVGAEDGKVTLLGDLKQYWDWEHPSPIFSGPALALVCMIAWAMTCFGEIRANLRCAYLLLGCVPRGETLLAGDQEHGFSIMRISTPRYIWIATLIVFQLAIAVSILIAGLIFIASTTKIETLLLHALAMEIIFTIDERLFEALCPATIKNLVSCLKPLEGEARAWRGLDGLSASLGVASFAAIIGVFCTIAWQTFGAVVGIHEALCGGHQNFYYGGDGTGILWATEPAKQVIFTSAEVLVDVYKEGKGSEYPFSVDSFATMTFQMNNFTSDELQITHNGSAAYPVKWCSDLIVSPDQFKDLPVAAAVTMYGPSFGEERIPSCEEVKDYCKSEIMIRMICPDTCGCHNPVGGVLINDQLANGGCPTQEIQMQSDFYQQQVASAPCQDSIDTSPWDEWGQQFEQLLSSTSPPIGEEWPCHASAAGECRDYFTNAKCGVVALWNQWKSGLSTVMSKNIDVCFSGFWTDELSLTALATLCPKSCDCDDPAVLANQSSCPSKCR